MKRLLMLVGVAVVAAAMYVAAATGSQQATGPTAKQFNALKKQVAALSKNEKAAKKEADLAAGFIASCLASANASIVPVNQFGTTTDGFLFGAPGTAVGATARTALDVDTSATPGALLLGIDPTCVQKSGGALRHFGSGRLPLLKLRVR